MNLTIEQACKLLGISRATAYRLRKSGQLAERLAQVSKALTPGVETPAPPVQAPEIPSAPVLESFTPRELSPIEQRKLNDLEFADRYAAGAVTDSFGNGGNALWPTLSPVSAIGPMEPRPRRGRVSGASHMHPRLIGDASAAPHPITSDELEERWHPGHKERKAAMYNDTGERKPSGQEQKQALDIATIAAAFRMGYSR